METIEITRTLDGRGKTITTFVAFAAHEQLEEMEEGELLEILTDDFEAFEHDLAAWCDARGDALVERGPIEDGQRFVVRKGRPPAKDSSLAMVVSSDGLEELLSPLAFALAAALEGVRVSLYFQGPAVRVLSHRYRPRLSGWARPFSRFAAAGMARSGHIPAQDKLRQLRALGGAIYVCAGSMDHFKVAREDLIFDDLPLVEYLTFMSVMEQADIHVYG
jgi:predicted peroxiredoxin/TusA-related sulfurtransferase